MKPETMLTKPTLSVADSRQIAAACEACAAAKARLAALGRRETKVYEEMINGGRFAFLSGLSQAGLRGAGLEGGLPITVDGHCVGAVGVSGVKSAEDAQIAAAGIKALTA